MINIGLINPKSASNVASVLRAMGCFNAHGLYYTGERYNKAKQFNADTKKVRDKIATQTVPDLIQARPDNSSIVVIELVEGATPLPSFTHPENAFYIFGPEDGSVSQAIINASNAVVYIPTTYSLNLAATVNIVLYDRLAKSNYTSGDSLIRDSRDTNNNTTVLKI